jgi:hypothetical protein
MGASGGVLTDGQLAQFERSDGGMASEERASSVRSEDLELEQKARDRSSSDTSAVRVTSGVGSRIARRW